jgi:glutamyl-tRNA reductase
LSVVVVGIEHQQAPLDVLERVAMSDAEVAKSLGTLAAWDNVHEVVVLSTCLRTEIYVVVDRFHDAVDDIWELLADRAGVTVADVQDHTTVRFDEDVASHLFSVAAGLESAVLGEGEVLGQVRRAWERAQAERASGPVLAELFRSAVQAGKRARAETGITRGTTSFSHAAVELAEGRRPGGLAGVAVAVVGAGEMGSGVAQALGALPPDRRPGRLTVVNRNRERGRQLAASIPAPLATEAAGTGELAETLAAADVAFTAVEAGTHLVPAAMLSPEGARERPILVIDLGVPRNVEPAAAAVDGVTLLDLDDLRSAVTRAIDERRAEAARAGTIVSEELVRYRAASRARGAGPVIAALRIRIEDLRAAELERRRAQLGELSPEAWRQVDEATRAVLAKVLHDPSVVLRESAGTPRGERLVEALRTLFGL